MLDIPRTFIDVEGLPSPYDFLLTQPLMTQGIETYYHGTSHIVSLCVDEDVRAQRFSRVILIKIKGKKAPVLIGSIEINTAVLPDSFLYALRTSSTPFGALLLQHEIKTCSVGIEYFTVVSDAILSEHLKCDKNIVLYGRTNRLIRAADKEWIANVVEILAPIAP